MKKEKWVIALAAGAGVAVAAAGAYSLLSKDAVPDDVIFQPFDKYRYLGTWNEIARLPNRVEKNIKSLTEEYSLNDDGTIKVVTKGYQFKKGEWKEFAGKIKFAGTEDVGKLKVSYLGPFYADYNILAIDPDYKYALVSGRGLGFLWILSRETTVPDAIKDQFLSTALEIGFAIGQLEWV